MQPAKQQKQSLACPRFTYRAAFSRRLTSTPRLTPVRSTGLTLQSHCTAVRWTEAGRAPLTPRPSTPIDALCSGAQISAKGKFHSAAASRPVSLVLASQHLHSLASALSLSTVCAWEPRLLLPLRCYSAPVYTSARFGYRKSACSSRYSIHCFKNGLPLRCALAACFGRGLQMRDTTETAARGAGSVACRNGMGLVRTCATCLHHRVETALSLCCLRPAHHQTSSPHVMQAV